MVQQLLQVKVKISYIVTKLNGCNKECPLVLILTVFVMFNVFLVSLTTIYMDICFCLFLVYLWIKKRNKKKNIVGLTTMC